MQRIKSIKISRYLKGFRNIMYEIDHRKLVNAMILVKSHLYAYLDRGLFLSRGPIIRMLCIHRQKIVQRSGIQLFRLFGGRHCLRLIIIK